MERRNTSKKRNFSEVQIETITSQVQLNKEVLFRSLKSSIKGTQKNAVWKQITAAVNSVAAVNRTPAEVLIFNLYIHDIYIYVYVYDRLYRNLYLG